MIPSLKCDPDINVITIGASLLSRLNTGSIGNHELFNELPIMLRVSDDHLILSLDWLFAIGAINYDDTGIYLIKGDDVFSYATM